MRYATGPYCVGKFVGITAVLVFWLSALPILANAQSGTQGQNAVYNSSKGIVGSSAFIDASMFPAQGVDFCGVLHSILSSNSFPAAGAVIDARGLPHSNPPTSMTCSASPWAGINNPPPSTILLPATGGSTPTPIVISTPWVIPSNTHLIGEGDGLGSDAGTTIQVSSGFVTTPGYFFQMGSASGASGISIERLTIDGKGLAINGIANQYAGRSSYVDHVSIYQFRGPAALAASA